ncbi:protein kinase domain-containing protein [Fischerella sp. PCC 9605]|uniref:protein kinase domain-containing protein n=1 Tax=Fischerella sp. PCC 9605 TaxID=1173024 RepID=UPI003FA407BE
MTKFMNYCINPNCQNRTNLDNINFCVCCGNLLLINNRYRLIKPLRDPCDSPHCEVFEVDDGGKCKVLKILKSSNYKYIQLFQQEAQILVNLRNSGIPKSESHEFFTWKLKNGQNLPCLVMEKIKGENLEQWLNENDNEPILQDLAINWLSQLTEILDYLHKNKFFHRDIKPSNIIRKHNGQLVLIDFGTARQVTETVVHGRDVTVIYSDGYTAPEQIEGRAVPQSDFFALGRTFVHLLTGKRPTDFSKDYQTGDLIWRQAAPQVTEVLADFIDKLMAPSLERRFQDTQEILQEKGQLILQLTWQQLKEIDPLATRPIFLEEKLDHSISTITVSANTNSPPYSVLYPEKYLLLQSILLELIGPIAPTLLEEVAQEVYDLNELVENFRFYLPQHQQLEFEKQVMFLLKENPMQSQINCATQSTAKQQGINESFLRRCEQELAEIIGPVATLLIDYSLESDPEISQMQLVQALAAEIPDRKKAIEFQQSLAS